MDQSLVALKLHVNDEIRRFSAPRNASFAQLIHLIRTVMQFAADCKIALKYSDAEGDICTIGSDAELAEAIRIFPSVLNLTMCPPLMSTERNIPQNSLVSATDFSSRKKNLEQTFASKAASKTSSVQPRKPARELDLESQGLALMKSDIQAAHNVFHHQLRISDPTNTKTVLYNIACCNSALGKTDSALSFLCRSIDAGFNDWIRMAKDPFLNNLRSMDSFNALTQYLSKEQMLVAEFGDHTGNLLINSQLHVSAIMQNLFNRACKEAQAGNRSGAIRSLELSLLTGFFNYKEMMSHPDLAVFANEEHFKKLVNKAATNFNTSFPQSKVELPYPEFSSSPVELKPDNHEVFPVKPDVEPREVQVDTQRNINVMHQLGFTQAAADLKASEGDQKK